MKYGIIWLIRGDKVMKKLLFLVVCCLWLCGCEEKDNLNPSNDLNEDKQSQLESINNKLVYNCSKYDIELGHSSNVILNTKNEKLTSKKIYDTYTCLDNNDTTPYCMTIESFEKDCTFNENGTCTLEKTFDNRTINISITNLNSGKTMIMTETTTYNDSQENYKDIILEYEQENYDCKIDTN